jgi:hypothetical protein
MSSTTRTVQCFICNKTTSAKYITCSRKCGRAYTLLVSPIRKRRMHGRIAQWKKEAMALGEEEC